MANMRLLLPFCCLLLSASAIPTYGPYAGAGIYHGPPAPLAQDGRVIDTPEVAHAKAAHLAAYAVEAAKASPVGYGDYSDGKYEEYISPVQNAYHGPPAPLAHDGRVIDTPEVAHAKAAHLAAHADQLSKIVQHYPQIHWIRYRNNEDVGIASAMTGVHVLVSHSWQSSFIPDEVTGHDVIVNAWGGAPYTNAACTPINWTIDDSGSKALLIVAGSTCSELRQDDPVPLYQQNFSCPQILLFVTLHVVCCAPQWYGGGHPGAYGGHAAPAPLGPDGRVVDTPEVAQLKAAHLAALADANARAPKGPGGPGGPYPGPAGPYAPGNYGAHYSGPPAPLGPDGRVVDTPEVQQAKAVHFSLFNAEAQRPAPPAPGPHNPSWNPSGAYNPSWNGNSWNQY
nr:PREDICTED: pupal cuticle protein-like [Megachile rotundata]